MANTPTFFELLAERSVIDPDFDWAELDRNTNPELGYHRRKAEYSQVAVDNTEATRFSRHRR